MNSFYTGMHADVCFAAPVVQLADFFIDFTGTPTLPTNGKDLQTTRIPTPATKKEYQSKEEERKSRRKEKKEKRGRRSQRGHI